MSNILLRPSRQLMCKLWLESIRPLRTCACVKKTRFCVDFLLIYLSVYLSVRFFVGATGHSYGAILTLNGSNDVISQPLVPLVVTLILLPTKGVESLQNSNFRGVNRRFQAKHTKYKNFHIIESTAAIPTKFSITIQTTE